MLRHRDPSAANQESLTFKQDNYLPAFFRCDMIKNDHFFGLPTAGYMIVKFKMKISSE